MGLLAYSRTIGKAEREKSENTVHSPPEILCRRLPQTHHICTTHRSSFSRPPTVATPHTKTHDLVPRYRYLNCNRRVHPRLQGPTGTRQNKMKKEKPLKSQNSLLREDCTCALAVRCSAPVVLLAAPLSPAASLHLLILLGDPFRVRLVHTLA
jgi:hypothetical protein